MIFRQLFDKDSSTFTYILGDEVTRKAVIIDPVYEQVDRDLELINELGLSLTLIINTHCHADHITGSGMLKSQIENSQSAIAKSSNAKADLMLLDGMVLTFGKYELKSISTPGHTAGCMSFYIQNTGSGGNGMVFTGDILLIRGLCSYLRNRMRSN
jgi:sulfur dioxygenase